MILETPFGTFKGSHKDISDVIKLHDNLIIKGGVKPLALAMGI